MTAPTITQPLSQLTASGITIRQALGNPPATSPAAWMYSPDLLTFTDSAPADLGLLTTRYDTAFVTAPVPQAGNYVYPRVMNKGGAPAKAIVYLFWAEHDPQGGSLNPLLNPTTWDSTAFTVDGKASNSVGIQADAGGVALPASPVVWTPGTLLMGDGHYCLIAWVDTSGTNPPPFGTLSQFATLDALRQYVEAAPNMAVLDTAYSGMLVRRFAGQQENVSAPSAPGWGASPDLLLFTGAPFDPAIIRSAPDWSFHQPPFAGQGNNLYVRGVNVSSGGLSVRVSFFYAVNNPTASNNPLLDPTTWKYDAMTMNGTPQNFIDLTSIAPADRMANTVPLAWNPAAPPAGARYVLIAWVDNTGGSNPPAFSALPKFASPASLAEYLNAQANVASWDTLMPGLFIRQGVGQQPLQPPAGVAYSPDIIVNNTAAVQDVSSLTTPSAYNSPTLARAATYGEQNFIYLRALNPGNGPRKARVYLYYTSTQAMSPGAWATDSFYVAGVQQNWVDLSADTANQVIISTVPVVWRAPVLASGDTAVLVAYADASDDPQPPDFSEIGYGNPTTVFQFIATQPQMAALDVSTNAPNPAPTMWFDAPLTPSTTGAPQMVGVRCIQMPTDGTISLSIPGPDGANTVVKSGLKIPDPNVAMTWPVTYPVGFANSVVVHYWQGANAPPAGANIVVAQYKA